MNIPLLTCLLDTLVPGDGAEWPAAGAHGLTGSAHRQAMATIGGVEALDMVLSLVPADFENQTAAARELSLKAIAETRPDEFEQVVATAYKAYYTDPAIRDVIARLTGYENRPPQPEGFKMEPFDERLLSTVRNRPPFWRQVGD